MSHRTRAARLASALFLSLLLIAASLAADTPVPAADADTAAALKVLARRVGTWDDEVTIKPGKWVPAGATMKVTTKVTWGAGGRFLRGEGEGVRTQGGQKQKSSSMWVLTWNKQKRQFNSWFFHATSGENNVDYWGGPSNPAVSEWNERTQTMTLESTDENGNVMTGSWHYIDEDHLEFGLVTKDSNGDIVFEQTGTSTRRKEK